MAEVQQETATPTLDIASLTGGGDKSAISDLVTMQKARTAEDFSITRAADKQLSSDQARVEKAYTAEGVGHDELKPWDANKEHAKFEHDPIEGFGSVGGVFAMVASAFTKTPMDNAINGMAGALNSIKAGDEAAYTRAYDSWKDNTKLALDRHKVQHDLYSDALSLMNANQGAAQAKLHNAAVRFGDSQMLTLAEHGMVKELFELQESRAKSAEMMQGMMDKTTLRDFQRSAVEAIKKNPPQTGDPVQDKIQLAAQVQRVFDGGGRYGSAEQEAVGRYVQANIGKEPGAFADGLAEIHQKFSPKAPNIEGYQAARQAEMDSHEGVISPEKDAELLRNFGLSARPAGAGSSGTVTENKIVAEEIKRRAAEYTANGMEPAAAFDKAMKEVKSAERKPDQPKLPSENNVVAQEINKRAADYVAAGMDPHEAFDKAMKEIKTSSAKPNSSSGNASLHPEKVEIDRRTKQYTQENIDKGMDSEKAHTEAYNKAAREVGAAGKSPSGNAVMQLDAQYQKAERMEHAMDQMEEIMLKHKFITGLGGTLTRPVEAFSNVLGSNATDRKQFQRFATELKEWGLSVVNDRTGRPLSSEAKDAAVVFAGLNPQDTGANTIRAIVELRPVIQTIKEQIKARGKGQGPVSGGSDTPPPSKETTPENSPWLKDPVKP